MNRTFDIIEIDEYEMEPSVGVKSTAAPSNNDRVVRLTALPETKKCENLFFINQYSRK